ncbi:MAG: endonuclease domain-containing protein [Saprospiraceae bacterium]
MHLPIYLDLQKALRRNPTLAEDKLWQRLRGKQTWYKFRRQHPMVDYVADFYCHALQYVIEVDGSIHQDQTKQIEDENKDINLESYGCSVQRFTNDQVLNDIETVMIQIHLTISTIKNKLLADDAE